MTMLTDEKIKELVSETSLFAYWYSHGDLLVQLVHAAIEAAVLEAQKQEPVAWKAHHGSLAYSRESFSPSTRHLATPLYAAPVVQPDMVMVPRKITAKMNEAAWSEMAGGDITSTEELQWAFDAMIAAAEGKK